MVNKRGREGRVQGRGVLRKFFFFEFYALLATQFSLSRRRMRRQQGRRYIPVSVTALTALFICLFKFWRSCFNAFRRALFAISVFYAFLLYIQLFRKFFRRVFRFFLFYSGAEDQRARQRRTPLQGTQVSPSSSLARSN